MIKDMTKGSPGKDLFLFALPMIFGNIFQQAYSIIDSIIVGNYVGSEALASIGASYPITFISITIANGAGIGSSVVISQYFGANKYSKVKSSIYTSLISIIFISSIILLLGYVFAKNILLFMNTPENIFYDAESYLKIYFLGTVFLFVYNIVNSSFNALGDSKTPLFFLILSSILNVILDLIFVVKFSAGVRGAAEATIISQGFSCVLSFIFLINRIRGIRTSEKTKLFNLYIFKSISRIAIPSILQQSIISVGNLFVQSLVNSFGSVIIAGYTAATKIDSITILPMVNMSNAVSSFTAQNIGGKKLDRVKKGYRAALKIIFVFYIIIVASIFIFGRDIVSLFVSDEISREVIDYGCSYLKVVSLFYIFMGFMVVTNGILRAAGDMKYFLLTSLINLGTRVFFAYMLSLKLEELSISFAVPLGWIFASIFVYVRYRSNKWQVKKVV